MLNPNKTHRKDEISFGMTKLCASSIARPLPILFENYFENEYFPKEQKNANIVTVHKKMKSSWSKITEQYHYCLFGVEYLKK